MASLFHLCCSLLPPCQNPSDLWFIILFLIMLYMQDATFSFPGELPELIVKGAARDLRGRGGQVIISSAGNIWVHKARVPTILEGQGKVLPRGQST